MRHVLAGVVACILSAGLAGCSWPSFLITPVSHSGELEEDVVQKGRSSRKIAIIAVEGMLVSGRRSELFGGTENDLSRFVQQLDKAAEDEDVAAVVLRVNSPGGTVAASDTMYQAVMRFKQKTKKPVIASVQDMGASGAYYVCCAADRIVAQPTSVVGSIGVVFHALDVSGTMMLIGLRSHAVKSAPLKDIGSPLRPMADHERKIIQGMIDEFFVRFVQTVRHARPVKESPGQIADYQKADYAGVFSGRVFTGEAAAPLGLIDQTGALEDAIDAARMAAKSPDAQAVIYRRPHGFRGSIYAAAPTAEGQRNVLHLEIAPPQAMLPTGFYYLWEP